MKIVFTLATIALIVLGAAYWMFAGSSGASGSMMSVDDASARALLQTIRNAGYPCAAIVSWSGAPRQPATVVCRVDGRAGGTPYLVSPDTGRVTPG